MTGKWKPGESGNPAGRPKGSLNQSSIRQRIDDILGETYTPESIEKDLKACEPKDRLYFYLRLVEFRVPKMRSIEAKVDQSEKEKSSIDLGLLTREQRKEWYALYDLARIKPNGQEEVDQVKTLQG